MTIKVQLKREVNGVMQQVNPITSEECVILGDGKKLNEVIDFATTAEDFVDETIVIEENLVDRVESMENKIETEFEQQNSQITTGLSNIKTIEQNISNKVDTEVAKVNAQLSQELNSTNQRISEIIAHNNDTDGNSELIDLRTDSHGYTYSSAGDFVRSIDEVIKQISTGGYKSDSINKRFPIVKTYAGVGDNSWLYHSDISLKTKTWGQYKYVYVAIGYSIDNIDASKNGLYTSDLTVILKNRESETIATPLKIYSNQQEKIENGVLYTRRYCFKVPEDTITNYPDAKMLFIQFGKSSNCGDGVTSTIKDIFITNFDDESSCDDFDKSFAENDFSSKGAIRIDYNKHIINKPDFEKVIDDKFNTEKSTVFNNYARTFSVGNISFSMINGTVSKSNDAYGNPKFTATANEASGSHWLYSDNIKIPDFEWKANHKYFIAVNVVVSKTPEGIGDSTDGNYTFNLLAPTISSKLTTPLGTWSFKNKIATIGADTDVISIATVDGATLGTAQEKNALCFQVGNIPTGQSIEFTIKGLCIMDLTEAKITEDVAMDLFYEYKYSEEVVVKEFYNINVATSENSSNAEYAKRAGSVDSVTISGDIEIWGDSLVAQGYGSIISEILGRKVTTKGYGGKTSTYIRDMFLSEANVNKVQIINVGRNNYQEPDVVIQDIRQMVNHIPHNNFLICCPPNGNYDGEGVDGASYKKFEIISDRLSKQYPSNFIDTRRATIQEYDMGNVKLTKPFTQPQINSQVTIHVSDVAFLVTYNSYDESRWGSDFMRKIVIGQTIDSVDVYRLDSYNNDDGTLTLTLIENNTNIRPGSVVDNGIDNGGNRSVKYCRVLQYADYYCWVNDRTQSTFRSDSIHMSDSGKKCIAKIVARKIDIMKI